MKHLSIAVISLIGFFTVFIALSFIVNNNVSVTIAIFVSLLLIPALLLNIFSKPWDSIFIKVCNYLIACFVVFVSVWYFYNKIVKGESIFQPIDFFVYYGLPALYFIFKGKLPFDLSKKDS